MAEPPPLPAPASKELRELPLSASAVAIYELLYRNRKRPMTMLEIREALERDLGEQEQLDRRRRELNRHFLIEKSTSGRETRYRLTGRKAASEADALGISERVRAQVLRFGRCEQCGRTPRDHGVVLQVDHRLPQSWGGTNDIENLQALCEECNRGKKDYYRTLDAYGEAIREAGAHKSVHHRLTALLSLVHPDEIRSDVLEMVAHQHQYQEDWQKRLRETRELGWNYGTRRERDARGRVWVYYRLKKRGRSLPDAQWRPAIRRAEAARAPGRR